jgi:hypothetical protein
MTRTIAVRMNVEVMGCPPVCQHWWATGRTSQAMPPEDVSWVVHEVRRSCDAQGLASGREPGCSPRSVSVATVLARVARDAHRVLLCPAGASRDLAR